MGIPARIVKMSPGHGREASAKLSSGNVAGQDCRRHHPYADCPTNAGTLPDPKPSDAETKRPDQRSGLFMMNIVSTAWTSHNLNGSHAGENCNPIQVDDRPAPWKVNEKSAAMPEPVTLFKPVPNHAVEFFPSRSHASFQATEPPPTDAWPGMRLRALNH